MLCALIRWQTPLQALCCSQWGNSFLLKSGNDMWAHQGSLSSCILSINHRAIVLYQFQVKPFAFKPVVIEKQHALSMSYVRSLDSLIAFADSTVSLEPKRSFFQMLQPFSINSTRPQLTLSFTEFTVVCHASPNPAKTRIPPPSGETCTAPRAGPAPFHPLRLEFQDAGTRRIRPCLGDTCCKNGGRQPPKRGALASRIGI